LKSEVGTELDDRKGKAHIKQDIGFFLSRLLHLPKEPSVGDKDRKNLPCSGIKTLMLICISKEEQRPNDHHG
jgi:hypothetical protein